MTSKVFQFNQKVPIGLVGGTPVYASWDFLKYLEEQRTRSGGNTAMTNLELESLSSDQADAIAAALAQANAAMAAANAAQSTADAALAGNPKTSELEINLGSTPKKEFKFIVIDPEIATDSKVLIAPSGKPATGRGSDDWLWDTAVFAAAPAAGQMTVYAKFDGRVIGKRNIIYQVN